MFDGFFAVLASPCAERYPLTHDTSERIHFMQSSFSGCHISSDLSMGRGTTLCQVSTARCRGRHIFEAICNLRGLEPWA